MRWKIWTENAQAQRLGGVYLFDTQEQAQAYLKMHSQRLDAGRGARHPQPYFCGE